MAQFIVPLSATPVDEEDAMIPEGAEGDRPNEDKAEPEQVTEENAEAQAREPKTEL